MDVILKFNINFELQNFWSFLYYCDTRRHRNSQKKLEDEFIERGKIFITYFVGRFSYGSEIVEDVSGVMSSDHRGCTHRGLTTEYP